MHKVYNFVRSSLKYTTVVLALILFVGQVSTLLNEGEEKNQVYRNGSDLKHNEKNNPDLERQNIMTLNTHRKDIKIFLNSSLKIDEISHFPKKSIPTTSFSYDECEKHSNITMNMLNVIFKCSLAFLAGGLLSDMKFIKFGVF
jgi:hypothetical protein